MSSNPWGIIDSPNLLPLATQEVPIDQFNISSDRGWFLFIWPPLNYDQDSAPDSPDIYQTWMGVAEDPWGTHATFVDGNALANINCFVDQRLPNLAIDYDYVDLNGYRSSQSGAYSHVSVE